MKGLRSTDDGPNASQHLARLDVQARATTVVGGISAPQTNKAEDALTDVSLPASAAARTGRSRPDTGGPQRETLSLDGPPSESVPSRASTGARTAVREARTAASAAVDVGHRAFSAQVDAYQSNEDGSEATERHIQQQVSGLAARSRTAGSELLDTRRRGSGPAQRAAFTSNGPLRTTRSSVGARSGTVAGRGAGAVVKRGERAAAASSQVARGGASVRRAAVAVSRSSAAISQVGVAIARGAAVSLHFLAATPAGWAVLGTAAILLMMFVTAMGIGPIVAMGAQNAGDSDITVADFEPTPDPSTVPPMAVVDGWTSPVPPGTPVTSTYGPRARICSNGYCTNFHAGIDLAQGCGAPIHAAADGVIVSAGPKASWGNAVVIDHGNATQTLYAHLAWGSLAVSPGQQVRAGDRLGGEGDTGLARGCHLHFEVYLSNVRIDPANFMSQRGITF